MHPHADCNCRYADVGCDKMETDWNNNHEWKEADKSTVLPGDWQNSPAESALCGNRPSDSRRQTVWNKARRRKADAPCRSNNIHASRIW